MRIKASFIILFSLLLINCSKDDEPKLSSENEIIAFKITGNGEEFNGSINQSTKTITVTTSDLDLSNSITPIIEISNNASISPSASTPQIFSQNIEYIVTAQNGEQATYTVITNNTPLSDEKKILNFQLNIDSEIFDGIIDHSALTIDIDTYKNPTNISPTILLSDGAIISPDSSEPQNFTNDILYTVTAANQSSNIYTVKTKWISFNTINSANNTSDIATKYYSNATPYIRTSNVDLSLPNSKIILENDINSYELNFSNYNSQVSNGMLFTFFQIEFPTNIVTANNYKLKYTVDNQIKSISNFEVDILSENIPDIISSNQTNYSYNDTLILTGQNLVPGIRIAAHNVLIYQYNASFVSTNSDGTELTLPLDVNQNMFPSWVGQPSPYPTPVIIYFNGRYGETIVVDFN